MLLGSAIDGPGFDSRGSHDAAIDMFSVKFIEKTKRKKKQIFIIKKKIKRRKHPGAIQVYQATKSRWPEPRLQASEI